MPEFEELKIQVCMAGAVLVVYIVGLVALEFRSE